MRLAGRFRPASLTADGFKKGLAPLDGRRVPYSKFGAVRPLLWLRLLGWLPFLFNACLGILIGFRGTAFYVRPLLTSLHPPNGHALIEGLVIQRFERRCGFKLVLCHIHHEHVLIIDDLRFHGVERHGDFFFSDAEEASNADNCKLDLTVLIEDEI